MISPRPFRKTSLSVKLIRHLKKLHVTRQQRKKKITVAYFVRINAPKKWPEVRKKLSDFVQLIGKLGHLRGCCGGGMHCIILSVVFDGVHSEKTY